MYRLIPLLAAALLLAACSGSATSSPAPTGAPAATPAATEPAASPATPAVPSATPTSASARLTFDGTSCVYTGPTVVTSPTVLDLEFVPTDEGFVVSIVAAERGTTREEIDRVNADEHYGQAPGHVAPDWMLTDTFRAMMGAGTDQYDLELLTVDGSTYDEYMITCVRDPWTSEKPADTIEGRTTGTVITVVEG